VGIFVGDGIFFVCKNANWVRINVLIDTMLLPPSTNIRICKLSQSETFVMIVDFIFTREVIYMIS
jgi:hypothetical protein